MSHLAINGGNKTFALDRIGPHWPLPSNTELKHIQDVLQSSVWGGTGFGQKIDQFNVTWSSYCDCSYGVAVANGTVSMELALMGLGVGERGGGLTTDEVIVPAWTFMATPIAVIAAGATPVFVDIEPSTLNLAPAAVEAALSPRTRAIIPVHFGGHPADMDRLLEIAAAKHLLVLEDAAQAHGAVWRGRKLGGFGAAGSYSFQQAKNLQCGEGGMVVTNSLELAERLHYNLSKFGRGIGKSQNAFSHPSYGINACMTEFQAAIALAQFELFETQTKIRSERGKLLREWLSEVPGIEPLPVDTRVDRHGNHLLLFRVDLEEFGRISKDTFIKALRAEGVHCNGLYSRPLYEEHMYDLAEMRVSLTRTPIRVTDCPATKAACMEMCAFPQSMLLAEPEILCVVPEALKKLHKYSAEISNFGAILS